MSILDKIKEQGGRDELRTVKVPEWGEKGKPLVISYHRPGLNHTAAAIEAHPNNPVRQNVDILCQIALGADGKPLFKRIDGLVLMEDADPNVVGRLLREMGIIVPSAAEAEKN